MVNDYWWPTDVGEQPNGRLVRNPPGVQGLKVHDPFFQFLKLKPKASLFFWMEETSSCQHSSLIFDAPKLGSLEKVIDSGLNGSPKGTFCLDHNMSQLGGFVQEVMFNWTSSCSLLVHSNRFGSVSWSFGGFKIFTGTNSW